MSVQWPNSAGTVTGFDSSTNLGSIPNSAVSLNALTLGAISFAATDLPNFPDGQGDYQINGTSAIIKPTGNSSGNRPNLYVMSNIIDPNNAGFNMSGGADGLQIDTLVGSVGGASVNYGPINSTNASIQQKSGTASNIGAHLVSVQVDAAATVSGTVFGLKSTATLNGTVANYVGVSITPSGSSAISSAATGLSIDMSGLSGIATGSAKALDITSGSINLHGDFTTTSNQGALPYNVYGSGFHVTANLTGTTMILNSLGSSTIVDAGKSVVSGTSPFPFSMAASTAGTRMRLLAGASVDSYVSQSAGLQIDAASVGTLTDMNAYIAGIDRSLGTGQAITNAYGFRVLSGTFSLSGTNTTNAWGVSIEDSGAKNLFAGQVQHSVGALATPALAFIGHLNDGIFYRSLTSNNVGTGPAMGKASKQYLSLSTGWVNIGNPEDGGSVGLQFPTTTSGAVPHNIIIHSGNNLQQTWGYNGGNASMLWQAGLNSSAPLNQANAFMAFGSADSLVGGDSGVGTLWIEYADLTFAPDADGTLVGGEPRGGDIGLIRNGSSNAFFSRRPRNIAMGGFLQMREQTTPANPPAGNQRLFLDSADQKLKRVDSAGTVVIIG